MKTPVSLLNLRVKVRCIIERVITKKIATSGPTRVKKKMNFVIELVIG